MKYVFTLLVAFCLLQACQSDADKKKSELATRAAAAANVDPKVLEESLAPIKENKVADFTFQTNPSVTSSNLGNGKYNKYLKMTYELMNNPVYKEEIIAARKVCIDAMINLHYMYSKEKVTKELDEVLNAAILSKEEQAKVEAYYAAIDAEMYQKTHICFECEG